MSNTECYQASETQEQRKTIGERMENPSRMNCHRQCEGELEEKLQRKNKDNDEEGEPITLLESVIFTFLYHEDMSSNGPLTTSTPAQALV